MELVCPASAALSPSAAVAAVITALVFAPSSNGSQPAIAGDPAVKPTKPRSAHDRLIAHESRAASMLWQRRPVEALSELEVALCLSSKHDTDDQHALPHRLLQLAASAVVWSLDILAGGLLSAAEK